MPLASGTPSFVLLNTETEGEQIDPTVTALADGRFLAVWHSQDDNGADTTLGCLRARYLDAEGNPGLRSMPAKACARSTSVADGMPWPCVSGLLLPPTAQQ